MASSWVRLRIPAFGQIAGTVVRVDDPSQAADLLNSGLADTAADPGGSPAAVPMPSPGGDLTTDTELAAALAAQRAALGLPAVATVTASGALVVQKLNPVDATAGAKTMTLPTGQTAGTMLVVEKVDTTANAVIVSGSLRGSNSTINLAWAHETLFLAADSAGSWWPLAGHKTKTALDAAYTPRTKMTSKRPFAGASNFGPGYTFRGYDATDQRVFATDNTNGILRQSSDFGTTWSTSKSRPAGMAFTGPTWITRFKGNLYLYGFDGTSYGVWRAAPQAGNTAFTWSAILLTLRAGATSGIHTNISADDTYIYVGEYGDPTGGPCIYRSADGVTWETTLGPDATLRHVHAIEPDPYNPGHVWATLGDGGSKTIVRSTNYGATWGTVVADFAWQGVQISFDAKYVYIAGDQSTYTFQVIDRTALTPMVGSPNWHANIQIPRQAALGDGYWANAYYGAVDPATGVYYCVANDTSAATGNWMGMFYTPGVGQPLQLLDRGGSAITMNGRVTIAGGYAWSANWRVPLITLG